MMVEVTEVYLSTYITTAYSLLTSSPVVVVVGIGVVVVGIGVVVVVVINALENKRR